MQYVQTAISPSIKPDCKEDNNPTKSYKIRPLLKSKAQWRCLNPSDLSYINKYKPKMLSVIKITHINFENIEIQPLCRVIKDLKKVSSLDFLQNDLDSKDLLQLINMTNHWKNLGIWNCGLGRKVLETLRVRRCKSLESLSVPSRLNRFIKEGIAKDFFRQIKGLAKLKALDINVNEHNLTAILDSKLHWSSVRDVTLTFPKSVQDCQKLLLKIQHVEALKLKFGREYNLEILDGQIWTSFFQKAQNLNNLIITVQVHEDQGTEGIQSFLECFKYFQQVTRLQFNFVSNVVGGKRLFDKTVFFDCLSAHLGTIVQLQSLELKIWVGNIKKSHLVNLISALQRLQNLQNLILNLSYVESPTEGLISLGQCIKNCKSLQALALRLGNDDINKKSLETFFQNIAHLSLQSLGLVFYPPTMILHRLIPSYPEIELRLGKIANFWKRKQDPASLFSPLFAFKLLTVFSLDLAACSISAEELKYLSAALKQMNKLSSLTLKLPQFDPANNFEGLQNLLASFKDLSSLTELDLTYMGACVQDQELALFGSNLRECRNLQVLKLEFLGAAKLNEKTLDHLLFGVENLRRLKKLYLTFDLSKLFPEIAVWKFLSELSGLKDLEVLRFFSSMKLVVCGYSNTPLPVPLKELENLRHLYEFVVDIYRFI